MSPAFREALRIVSDHLWYAQAHPEVIEEAARRNSLSKTAQLSYAVVIELFDVLNVRVK